METSEIKELINSISKSSINIFDFEENGVKLHLEKGGIQNAEVITTSNIIKKDNEILEEVEEERSGNVISSPLVGTVYMAPGEGEEPFVREGDTVKKGQVVAIVEAMKLMNEIESEFDGVVKKILVENAQTVEYGQPLFEVE